MPTPIKIAGRALAIAIMAIIPAAVIAGQASARTVPVYSYTGEFYDGTGSTAGLLASSTDVEVSQETGNVYVADPARFNDSVSQFDASNDPLAFSALNGATAISLNSSGVPRIAVDQSPTQSHGNIYALDGVNTIRGYRADGSELGAPFPASGFLGACALAVDSDGHIWVMDQGAARLVELTAIGAPTGRVVPIDTERESYRCDLAIDSHDNFYVSSNGQDRFTRKYDSDGKFLYDLTGGGAQAIAVDRATDHVFILEGDVVAEYDENGDPLTSFGSPDPAHSFPGLVEPQGVAVNETTHRVYVANGRDYGGRQHVDVFAPSSQITLPIVKTNLPTLAPTSVTLRGSVDPDGAGDATNCRFEWGTSAGYGEVAPCTPAGPISGNGVHPVTADLSGLAQGSMYHYRLVVASAQGTVVGRDRSFRPQGPATISGTVVSQVNTDGARVTASVDPNGGDTSFRVEYGLNNCDLSACLSAPSPEITLSDPLGVQTASVVLSGLEPDSSYHFRLVATNSFGEALGKEDILRTYAVESTDDACPNALLRKAMGAVLMPDCRAFELVSAAEAGGYDVRSDLVPGQVPLAAKPRAKDSVLYSINFGKIPGVEGEPTNHGLDPYIATRTTDGWSTRYAGIAVGGPPYQDPFASTPLEESEDLSTVAFGGEDICDPCFGDGSTGIPLRRGGAALAQGMAGTLDPGPSAAQDGFIGRRLSADGTHLIFGSTSAFEPDAATGGDLSIYSRDLVSGTTQVVSKTPSGESLPCLQGAGACHSPDNGKGIGELDVSDDGSRVVVANRVSTDSAGNDYWHPYMHIGDSSNTVDLAPGATSGVIYDGMTGDGSEVFYTTANQLTPDDHDSSADIYRAAVSEGGAVTVTRVSVGSGAGDTDACNPVPATGNNWNAPGGSSTDGCGVVAFAGGGGVARGDGAIYFLSPEQLDGSSGEMNQPNLYLSAPGGSVQFVATLEAGNAAIEHAVYASAVRIPSDIQVTPNGNVAVFSSKASLTDFPSLGHVAIYRYSTTNHSLVCASCPTTRAALTADTRLSAYGLNLADDGRVFFTSAEPLALQDTGTAADVYEWSEGKISLISTGRSQTDAGLLSVSADGVNVYFYTRETLVRGDHNGMTMKIYTARENGGFPTPVTLGACQASDECHGPGSVAPPAEALPTFQGTGGNVSAVHKKKQKQKKKKKHHRRGRKG